MRDLGIALVPWSPLGSGFLTGAGTGVGKGDFRNHNPRYAAENLAANRDRFAPLMQLAKERGLTPAQLALAWLLHQGPHVVPIPGTSRSERIDENAASATVQLDSATLARINALAPAGLAKGATLID